MHFHHPERRGFYQWAAGGVPGYPAVGPHGVLGAEADNSRLRGGRSTTGLIAVFDGASDRAIALSPASSFLMTSSELLPNNATLRFGLQGSATSVPTL